MDKEINITYETLFELFRREKTREELQKLDKNFFEDVVNYLKEKQAALNLPKNDIFAAEERRKAEMQLENIKNILKEFYEKREKKIINMALDMSRTGMGALNSEIVDTSAMLKEEKGLFDLLVKSLNNSRKGVLYNILEAKVPDIKEEEKEAKEEAEQKEEVKADPKKKIRFLQAVPKFIGTDLQEYGPFEKEDSAGLPAEIADILINKGRAEEMQKEQDF
jgi:DNA replication initiation complex subunit (GINS family)